MDGRVFREERLSASTTHHDNGPQRVVHKNEGGNGDKRAANHAVGKGLGYEQRTYHGGSPCRPNLMSLHTRICEAYADASGSGRKPGDTGGGFVAEEEPVLPLSALPGALTSLGLRDDLYDELYELLQDSAVMSTSSTRSGRARRAKVVPRDAFIEAVSVALRDVPEEELNFDDGRAAEDESDDYDAGADDDEALDEEEEELYNDLSDEDVVPVSRPAPVRRATAAQKERAAFLYRLVLERIPLVTPEALKESTPDRNFMREVSDEELHARQIGIEELSYALQCLGEPMAVKEMHEMLEFAVPDANQRRIGVDECVATDQIH